MKNPMDRKFANSFALAALAAFSWLAAACGGAGSSTVTMAVKSGATADSTAALQIQARDLSPLATSDYGEANVGASGVSSFKLYVSGIQLCNDLTPSGTGYSNTTGCTSIYSNNADNYDSFSLAQAAAAGADKYIDLVSATDRAKLTKSAKIDAGTYNYGLINWYKPVKVTAQVNRTGGTNLCTKAYTGGTLNASGNLIFAAGGLACGTAAESIAMLNNGGTWFKFLRSFTADKDGSYAIDLAFNLDGQVKGGNMSNVALQDANGVGINVPMLKVVPVPRGASDSTKVESFVMTPAGSTQWKLRVDLYYASSDAAKTILAADMNLLSTAATDSNLVTAIYAPVSISNSGTTFTFKDYLGNTSLVFDRAGTTGTLTCPSGATLHGCTSGATTAVTFGAATTRTLN